MGPATATRLTAVTVTPITPLSDATSTPPLMVSGVIGTKRPIGEAEDCEVREVDMSEKIKSEMISRRGAFSLLGLAAALASAVPITVLTVSDAEAQTAGMERREQRRAGRQERRQSRRTGRQERRQARRTGT